MSNNQHFSYKGYTGSIETSTEDMCLFGKIQMIRDLVMYDGETLEELRNSFESAVDDYLLMCEEEGKIPDKPCSGTFNVRMSEELHRKSIHEANILGLSLNAFVVKSIKSYFEENLLKNEFLFVSNEALTNHLNEIRNYNLVERCEYTIEFNMDADPLVIESIPYKDYNNEGTENV